MSMTSDAYIVAIQQAFPDLDAEGIEAVFDADIEGRLTDDQRARIQREFDKLAAPDAPLPAPDAAEREGAVSGRAAGCGGACWSRAGRCWRALLAGSADGRCWRALLAGAADACAHPPRAMQQRRQPHRAIRGQRQLRGGL